MSLEALNEFLQHTQLDSSASMVERARQVAVQAHLGQTRWNGDAYVTHPFRVAEAMLRRGITEDGQIVANLHDVIEDTDVTLDDLRAFGFSEEQIVAVDSVTKRNGENYLDFVLRAKANPIGRCVKIEDIEDNLRDITDAREGQSRDLHENRRAKYQMALWILRID